MRCIAPAFLIIFALLAGTGCDNQAQSSRLPETEEPLYKAAQKAAETNKRAAIEKYLQLIDRRNDAAESHLEIGGLYLDPEIDQPLDAIYHFRQSGRLSQSAERNKNIAQRIRSAEKKYIAKVTGRLISGDTANAESEQLLIVKNENDVLKKQIVELREKINALEARQPIAAFAPVPQADITPFTPPPPPKPTETGSTYIVKSGDSLMKISRAVYGNGNRWKEIYNANRDQLPNERALRIGMELKIPR